ncbi:MAG TPA: tyrosine-type recombinase/integrase [Flavipsychrobacter sp.]|nr:tyrosine-type recombinase/integrase [Flavipsychrobacter sp.]
MNNASVIPPYKDAKVYNGEKEWFVYYSYYSRKLKKYIREKVRLEKRGLTREKREDLLQILCKEVNQVIRNRNRLNIYHDDVVTAPSEIKAGNTLQECAEYFKDSKDLSESSRKNISYFLYSYNQFLKENPAFSALTINDIDGNFIKHFKEFLQRSGKASKTINSYLWAIQLITESLVKLHQLEQKFDTTSYRVKLIKNETDRYRPLTHEEKTKVFEYSREHLPYYYLYLLEIYYTSIRPAELRRLKINYLNFAARKIKVPWFAAKNGLSNYVQMFDPLYNAYTDLGIDKIENKEMFLHSSKFAPGESFYKGKWASDVWRIMCKKIGIADDANMYGLKHTFNVDYVEMNKYKIDWEFLRRHNRHATVQQTQQYISGLTAYFLDETKNIILNYHQNV